MSGDLEMASLRWIVRGQGRKDILNLRLLRVRTGWTDWSSFGFGGIGGGGDGGWW